MSLKNILLIAFVLLSGSLLAQSKQDEIRLVDLESGLPIVEATFEYGTQRGLSDENGIIRIQYLKGVSMNLSHINYGQWAITEDELVESIQKKVHYRSSRSLSLYPVTVIAVKPPLAQLEDKHKIEYQDRLEHDAANILNQTPAFSSIRKGGNYGFDPVFRGFKYDQLNVVMNGAQSATAACPNRMDPPTSQMAPNMLDRIEILKGPYALRFGTGIGATINFIPSPLRFSSEPRLYGRLSGGYEENGNLVRGEGQLGLSGKKYDIGLFASWSQGDDYVTGKNETVQADFSRGSFGGNVGFKLGANQQLRLSTTYNRARDADFPALPMDLREDDTWLFNARHDIQLNRSHLKSWNTTVFGSFVDHLMNNGLKLLNPRMLNAETTATTHNYGGRTEGVWQFGHHQLYAGADLRAEGASGIRRREFLRGPMQGNVFEDNAWQDGHISKTGVFVEYQINGQSLNYVLSGRLELNVADINELTDEFEEVHLKTRTTQVNPGFSFGIMKDFGTKVQAGLWLARVQRSGSLTERFINYFPVGQDPYEMLGNPQLDSEKNYQTDLTLKWRINKASVITTDFYVAYLQDYISSVIDAAINPRLAMSPGVRQYVNIDEVFKTGFEVSWTQDLALGLSHRLGIAYTYGQDLQRDAPLPEIAPLDFRYSLQGNYLKKRLQPEIAFRYVAEQSRISTEFGEMTTPAFALLDFRTSYRLSSQIAVQAGVNNVLDNNYYEHLNRSVRGTNNAVFAPGRNVFVNLSLAF